MVAVSRRRDRHRQRQGRDARLAGRARVSTVRQRRWKTFWPTGPAAGRFRSSPNRVSAAPRSACGGSRRWSNSRSLPRQAGYIVQAIAPGDEYTIDVMVDRRGRCLCAVPRKRLEVRAGEVSKGMTERQEPLWSRQPPGRGPAGAYGALNVQVFWDRDARNDKRDRNQSAFRRRISPDLASGRAVSPVAHRGDPRPAIDRLITPLERSTADAAV